MSGGVACPICGSASGDVAFELGPLPVPAHRPFGVPREARACPRGRVRLAVCQRCGHGWNDAFGEAGISYEGGYENSLMHSGVYRRHAARWVRSLVQRLGVRRCLVAEVGCGDGEFLRAVVLGGQNRGLGIDPSMEGPRHGPGPIRWRRGAFGVASRFRADALVARHVLEHVASPRDFLRAARRCVLGARPGVLFLEVPNFGRMMRDGFPWDLIVEHASWFTSTSLRWALRASGFRPLFVRESFGGQFLVAAAVPAGPRGGTPGAAAWGQPTGMRGSSRSFRRRALAAIGRWRRRVAKARGKWILWGAGSKGLVFLNLIDPHRRVFACAIDVNPAKQGRFIAGTGHRILGPEALAVARPEAVVVANALYRGEVARRMREMGLDARVVCL